MRNFERPDLRRRRAERLVAAIMHEAYKNPALDEVYRDMADVLIKVLSEEGVEVLTDYDREQCGLPARGPDGWTIDEIVALERRRLEVLTRPLTFTVPALGEPVHEKSTD